MRSIIDLVQYPVGHFLNASQGGPFTYCRHGGWPECELQAASLCVRERFHIRIMVAVQALPERFGKVTGLSYARFRSNLDPRHTAGFMLMVFWHGP